MSEKVCAVCGKTLTPKEIRINGLRRGSSSRRKTKRLCSRCRQLEYDEYMKAVKKLIEKF